jgi:hypothetical protein
MSHEPFVDLQHDRAYQEMMKLFEELTFRERMRRMLSGLSLPKDTGEYKFAQLQLQRLSAPFLATVIPLFVVGLMVAFGGQGQLAQRNTPTEIINPETIDELEEPPEPPDQQDVIDPVEMDVTVDINQPNEVSKVTNEPMSPQPADFNSVAIVKSPIVMRGIYGSRTPGAIGQAIASGHGNSAGEASVMRALRWLKKNQQSDGSWQKTKDAMTALAVLSFLAHGERPGESAEFGDTVQKGIEYLIKSQSPAGTWPGNYQHPIATYALCEAYGMTMNPVGIMGVIRGQHPSGGWDYGMKQSDRDDTSVMGWAAQALKAASASSVLDDKELLDKACKLSVQGFLKNSNPNGGFGYDGRGATGLSSVGTLCMQFHGAGNHAQVQKTQELMDGWALSWDNPVVPGKSPQYYFYYATQAKFHAGKDTARWKTWNAAMLTEYTKAQKVTGKAESGYVDAKGNPQEIGWWENNDHAGSGERPVMDTCLAALQLMVYYRYLPTFKTPEIDEAVLTTDADEVKVDIKL